MTRYAVSHPGKMGDAMYALPFIRYIYGVTGSPVDFYTSKYCELLRSLFEYQPCINKVIIPDNYEVERMDMGCQPWQMPIPDGYTQTWQCGFRRVPDRALHQFIAHEQGIDIPLGIRYEVPNYGNETDRIMSACGGAYNGIVCIAPRGESSYKDLFNTIADNTNAVIIGGKGDYTGHGYDATGLDLLTTAELISMSTGFVGLMSAMLVLANGFDIPRIAPHDNKSWDMRHVVYTPYNHYPVNPTADQILDLLGIK